MKKYIGIAVLFLGCGFLVMGVLAVMKQSSSMVGTFDIKGPLGLGGALCCLIGGIRLMMPPRPF
jgi:hypothetical protein